MIELNPAQQAAWDFAVGCAEEHPQASAEIDSIQLARGLCGTLARLQA